jgi:hypothetical protein
MKYISALASFVVIIFLTGLSFDSLLPANATLASAPDTEFSAERALVSLREIAKAPHYHGTDEHTRVRNFIISELKKLGLETAVQEEFVLSNKYQGLIKPKNIVARLKGSGTGKALVLLSHYDSALVPSFGASDAGSGVVTILESLRAYNASGKKPINDIIVLFTDAEEIGLDGASLFVNKHPWAKNIDLVLNFEARGSGGPSNMIVETNGGNTNLIKAFAAADVPYPVASSLMYSVYKMLPNDTDSTIFREDGNIESMFFAFIDDHYDYHTANDTVENLDIETLQHQGSYLLPLLHYFATSDLSTLKADTDAVYVNMPLVKFIYYPFSWILPMLCLAFVLFFVVLGYGFSRHKLNLNGVLKGFSPLLLSLTICGILGFFGWKLITYVYPQYQEIQHGFKYNGHAYIGFFVALSLGILCKAYSYFSKRNSVVNLFAAPLFLWLVVNVIVFVFLKGAAFFIIPVFFGLLSWFLLLRFQTPSLIGMALLAAPGVFLFAPLIQFFPVGLGSDHIVISCVFTVLLFGLLLPVFGFYKLKNVLSYLFLALALVCFIVAHTQSSFSEIRQKPNSLSYYNNLDTKKAYWVTYDAMLDPWTQSYLGEEPKPASAYIESAAGNKYNRGFQYAAEAPVVEIPEFDLTINYDSVHDGMRAVGFTITPQRDAHQMRLYTAKEVSFSSLQFNGVNVSENDSLGPPFFNRVSDELLRYYIADTDSLQVSYTLPENEPSPTFKVLEYGFDLVSNPLLNVMPRAKNMMPKPFINTDAVINKKSFSIQKGGSKQDTIQ